MAKVIGVHGIGNTFATSAQLSNLWFDALQGALRKLGVCRWHVQSLT
jgi:hypothetical protein